VLEEYGRKHLTRALVAAVNGTAVVSSSRKANQASYQVNSSTPEEDPLRYGRREREREREGGREECV
jgi:hypothetical protein